MIICFSGTGNSRRVADQLQDILGDEIIRLAPGLMTRPEQVHLRVPDGRVIWVMPVHCWGMPKVTKKVVRKARITASAPIEHYLVMTCGDDIGYADRHWRKAVRRNGGLDMGAYSVQMPNSYTFMKGFDVDDTKLAQEKLQAAVSKVEHIAASIDAQEKVTDVVHGSWPWLKSYVVYPWFMWRMTRTKPFHATETCGGCGTCVKACPLQTITLVDGKPKWGKPCTMCLRCYHMCPKHAIAYGTATKGKGQYMCPGFMK